MNKPVKTPAFAMIGTVIATLCAAVGAVLYGISYVTAYDTDIRHYDPDCATIKISFVLLVAAAIISVALGLLLGKKYAFFPAESTQLESFMLWLVAFMFLGFAVACVMNGNNVETVGAFGNFCIKATPWLSVLSSIPFICASSKRLSGTVFHGFASFIPIFWAASVMFKYYFDLHEVPLNDEELALTIASLTSVILFLLTESRIAIGIDAPGNTVFAGCLCLCVSGFLSVARIILIFTAEGGLLLPTLMECIMMVTLSALAMTRILAAPGRLCDKPKPEKKEPEAPKGEAADKN